jgi:hypothetical protein
LHEPTRQGTKSGQDRKVSLVGRKKIKPISALEGPRKVSHYHTGPWIRNWTGLRPEKQDDRWNRLEAPARSHPAAPPPPVVFRVPLTITLVGSTRRTEQQSLHLIDDVCHIFQAAGVVLEVAEMAEIDVDVNVERLPNGEWKCPFGDDVDHRAQCLHLSMVEQLGDLDMLVLSCGRCLLLPDHPTSDVRRAAAEGIATLLGLMMVRSVDAERLMVEGGTGMRLSGKDCQTLRYHASHFLGQDPIHARNFAVPIWAYQVCGPERLKTERNVQQLQALLRGANEIWAQADLHLKMHAWCHIQENEVSDDDWRAIMQSGLDTREGDRLVDVTAHDPHALHIFFLRSRISHFEVACDAGRRIIVVSDELGARTVRALARVVGNLLGLHHVPQPEQLMCAQTEETLLTPHEIEVARSNALSLVYGSTDEGPLEGIPAGRGETRG